jgi:hypothetical protein
MHLTAQRDGNNLDVELAGTWRGTDLPAIDAEIAAVSLDGVGALRITVPESLELDLAGAWTLRQWTKAAEKNGVSVEFAAPCRGSSSSSTTVAASARAPASSSEPTFEPVARWAASYPALDQREDGARFRPRDLVLPRLHELAALRPPRSRQCAKPASRPFPSPRLSPSDHGDHCLHRAVHAHL